MVINIASDIYVKTFHWHISKLHEITMRVRLFLIPQRQFHDINVMGIKLKEKIYRARNELPTQQPGINRDCANIHFIRCRIPLFMLITKHSS